MFFIERNFCDMVINWIISFDVMVCLFSIDVGKVKEYGLKFLLVFRRLYEIYKEMMGLNFDYGGGFNLC